MCLRNLQCIYIYVCVMSGDRAQSLSLSLSSSGFTCTTDFDLSSRSICEDMMQSLPLMFALWSGKTSVSHVHFWSESFDNLYASPSGI